MAAMTDLNELHDNCHNINNEEAQNKLCRKTAKEENLVQKQS